MDTSRLDPLAIASLTCGILCWFLGCSGVLFGFFGALFGLLSVPLALASVVAGALSIRRINAAPGALSGKELSVAGLTMGALNLLVSLGYAAVVVFFIGGVLFATYPGG